MSIEERVCRVVAMGDPYTRLSQRVAVAVLIQLNVSWEHRPVRSVPEDAGQPFVEGLAARSAMVRREVHDLAR
jgi:hypothetical protein